MRVRVILTRKEKCVALDALGPARCQSFDADQVEVEVEEEMVVEMEEG